MKTRLSDSSSVYLEERYQDGGSLTGLTHATGINLVARERWNLGASAEFGTLRDSLTGAETDRKAAGVRMGYGVDAMQFSSAIEYRRDDAEQLDTTHTETDRVAVPQQLQVPADAGLARGRQAEPLGQRQLARRVLRRRLHRGRGRLRVPSGAERPAERPGQVHVLLQRPDHGSGGRCRTPRPSSFRRATSRRSI